MANRSDRSVALMSIHPTYATQILDGSKRVEFRRSRFARTPDAVVVYATAPVCRVIGFFEVEGIDEASPSELWKRYRTVGGIARVAYRDYYRGAKRGVAIRVGRVHTLDIPLELSLLIGDSPPPQSFRYLREEILAKLATGALDLLRGQQVLPIVA